jgi:hypothetical protein
MESAAPILADWPVAAAAGLVAAGAGAAVDAAAGALDAAGAVVGAAAAGFGASVGLDGAAVGLAAPPQAANKTELTAPSNTFRREIIRLLLTNQI